MSGYAFLAVLSPSIGLLSSLFFVVGMIHINTSDIKKIGATIVGSNPHIMKSFASQKAEYICGAILLFVAFGLQLAGNIWSSAQTTQLFETAGQAWLAIFVVVVLVGSLSLCLRHVILRLVSSGLPEPIGPKG